MNLENINNYGLIEIYETILRRGKGMSIESGINFGPANDALLLSALARAPGHKLERWQIAEIIGGTDAETPSASTLEMRISRLRKKLATVGAPPPHIKAMHKVGYTLCTPVVMK